MTIKEFLPNPIGNDKDEEYILLFNDGASVSLGGWKIADAAGKEFFLKGNLESGQELRLPYSETKISLNNNGEKIFLYDTAGSLIDELSYSGRASEGQIIGKLQTTNKQMTNEKLMPNSALISNNSISSSQPSISKNVIFIDFLIATILAGLMLYIILQLEKKLNQPLF